MAAVPSSSLIQSQFWSCRPSKSCKLFLGSNSLYKKHTVYTSGKTAGSLLHSDTIHNRRMKLIAASVSQTETGSPPATYLLWTEYGGPVNVVVAKKNVNYSVYIELSSLQISVDKKKDKPLICWSIFRSDSSDKSRTIETAFTEKSLGKFTVELEFEPSLAPLYLSFLVKLPTNGKSETLEIKSHRKTHFCVPVGLKSGHPAPLGFTALYDDSSINFALFSPAAESVILCLYDDTSTRKPTLEIALDPYINRTGGVWHVSFDSSFPFTKYGYRICNGDETLTSGVLLDPYAKIIETVIPSSLLPIRLGKLSNELPFDWNGDVPLSLPMETLFVYRLNVKKFTIDKSSNLPNEIAGTFMGITEKLQHFKSLGVNAILLEPIFPFDEQQGPYFPLHFFSPENQSSINSMKEMVKTLHENGIEILLEVVFTESGALQGFDNDTYLRDGRHLNCNHPIVQELILDSLGYWVTEFHIDGFCFINASSLLMGTKGEILHRPPLVEAIAFDPLLHNTKIIADYRNPFETETEEKLNVRFPHWKRWAEMNDRFRDDVRKFLKHDGLVSDLATRICGSGDIFKSGRGPNFSFNFVAGNWGLSLVDLVSFSNGSGLVSEISWNCGEEGPTKSSIILQKRLKQIRNFLFIQFISLGIPVLNSGDECGQSSGGSTKYADRSAFNWSSLKTGFGIQTSEFISFLTCLRTRRNDAFQRSSFLSEKDIEWRGKDGKTPIWEDPMSRFLAVVIKVSKGDMFIAFNGGDRSENVVLPTTRAGMEWFRLVDTGLSFPGFFMEDGEMVIDEMVDELDGYKMKSHSCVLFEARPQKDAGLVNSL
ncbi:isoamylase 2, chloroplastic [Impatiens glandulifera]|uniref:isoamylase 2, chloroplastic n=1 Tax=Impatiens glandulifera TaxID=253017 RepID=UPI001FB19BA4|nr:isoamylase 2, chloroplastic [Impatiens glandulifera]